jgi:hypothetical protein
MMGRHRTPWPQIFDQSSAGELRAHPLYATEIRQSIVSLAIDKASGMTDEDLFDFPTTREEGDRLVS